MSVRDGLRPSITSMNGAGLVLLAMGAVACGSGRGRAAPCSESRDCSSTQRCVEGRCVEVEPEPCGSSTCDARQRCLFEACYELDCPQKQCNEGQVCEEGACIEASCVAGRCASGTCDSVWCPSGCCEGSTCVPYAVQGESRCGTGGAACKSCGVGEICAATTHDCCEPSCVGRCAGASDGCGGVCDANQCATCCADTVCEPFCGGGCCDVGQACVGSAFCCQANNEPVATIPMQNNQWPQSPYTISPGALQYFRFDVAQLSDVTVYLDDMSGVADLNLLVKGGFVPTRAEYDAALVPPYTGSGEACMWYAFEQPGDYDESVVLTAAPAARYYVLVHNAGGLSSSFRVGFAATPR